MGELRGAVRNRNAIGASAVGLAAGNDAITAWYRQQPAWLSLKWNLNVRHEIAAPVTVELVADRSSRRLLGGAVVGADTDAGRINVVATALTQRMRVDDFEQLDLAYAPPYAPVWDPLLIAAQQLAKQ